LLSAIYPLSAPFQQSVTSPKSIDCRLARLPLCNP